MTIQHQILKEIYLQAGISPMELVKKTNFKYFQVWNALVSLKNRSLVRKKISIWRDKRNSPHMKASFYISDIKIDKILKLIQQNDTREGTN